MERNQFKAFQPVLVRNSETAHWKTAHYSNYNEQRQQHFCDNQPWEHVLPYNELTADLIGTTRSYYDPCQPDPFMYIVMCNYDEQSWPMHVTKNITDAYNAYWQAWGNKDEYPNHSYRLLKWNTSTQQCEEIKPKIRKV